MQPPQRNRNSTQCFFYQFIIHSSLFFVYSEFVLAGNT
jgi:hypothetical protein